MQGQGQEGIAEGIENAFGNERYPNLGAGNFRLKVQRLSQGITYKKKTPYFKTTVTVVESDSSEFEPGSDATIMIYRVSHDMHLPELRELVAAILATPLANVGKATVNEVSAADNPAEGREFLASVTLTEDGFPRYKFRPVELE